MPNYLPKLSVAAAAILFANTALPAHAEEKQNFEGVKVGVQAGWEQRQINEVVLTPPNNARISDKSKGLTYGGFVGYDAQLGSVVLGVEADFAPSGKTLRSAFASGTSVELDSKWTASVSARAGVTLTPKLLAYGRVGYDLNRYRINGNAAGNTTPLATQKATGSGLLYGGGLEYAVDENASLRVEYRRRDQEGTLGGHQVLGGLTLRF